MSAATEPATSKQSLIGLLVIGGVCFLAWAIGGMLTRPNLEWYATLTKPEFTPPNAVFPVVWAILFVTMAISAWLVWRAPGDESDKKVALTWFCIQLAINVLWSFTFFFMRNPAFGFGVVLTLLICIVITIVLAYRLSRAASLLLLPYALWVCFAAGLNFTIWVLNSGYDFNQAS